jgi:hypothetical protein
MEHRAAGHQEFELWTGGQEIGKLRRGFDHLLKVIEDEQKLFVSQKGAQMFLI